jgi:hypothetical protein
MFCVTNTGYRFCWECRLWRHSAAGTAALPAAPGASLRFETAAGNPLHIFRKNASPASLRNCTEGKRTNTPQDMAHHHQEPLGLRASHSSIVIRQSIFRPASSETPPPAPLPRVKFSQPPALFAALRSCPPFHGTPSPGVP